MSAETEGIVIDGKVNLPFSYSAGATASRFFVELRDRQRIMGKRCPGCGRVIVPPPLFCKQCFVETAEWLEVGPRGTLITYTVVFRRQPHHPMDAPLPYGIIRLDGADTSIVHLLGEVEPDHIRDGMRMRAVFRKKRQGNILDIAYFKPDDQEDEDAL